MHLIIASPMKELCLCAYQLCKRWLYYQLENVACSALCSKDALSVAGEETKSSPGASKHMAVLPHVTISDWTG